MRRGLTLVEIMVVIALVGALAGIAYPVIGGFREGAQRASCMNQLRGLGAAVEGYLSDYGGFFPDLEAGRQSKFGGSQVLEEVLIPYVGGPEDFHCPADHEDYEKSGSSYFWNHHVSGIRRSRVIIFGMDSRESQIPLIFDKEAYHGDENGTNFLFMDLSAGKDPDFQVDVK